MDFLDFVRKVAQERKGAWIAKHYGPGPHKGTGTPQSIHAGARQRKGTPKGMRAQGKGKTGEGKGITGADKKAMTSFRSTLLNITMESGPFSLRSIPKRQKKEANELMDVIQDIKHRRNLDRAIETAGRISQKYARATTMGHGAAGPKQIRVGEVISSHLGRYALQLYHMARKEKEAKEKS